MQVIVADLLGDLHEVAGTFDFAYDWEFLHHIFPEDRETCIKTANRMLNPGTPYLSVCFSEDDPPIRRNRENPEDPDRDDALLLLGARDPGARLHVFHHPGAEDDRDRRQVRPASCRLPAGGAALNSLVGRIWNGKMCR